MTDGDPLEGLAKALLDAARRERPREEVREKACQLRPTVSGSSAVKTWRRVSLGLAAAAMVTVTVVALRKTQPTVPISAERAPFKKASASPSAASPVADEPAPEFPVSAVHGTRKSHPNVDHGTTTPVQPMRQSSLSDEVETLDRASAALSEGDPNRSMRILEEYDHVLHGTRLVAEATLLRIEALARLGRTSAASELARRFIDASPGNALAERARAFVIAGSTNAPSLGADSGGLP
jgi:hypothetical protein